MLPEPKPARRHFPKLEPPTHELPAPDIKPPANPALGPEAAPARNPVEAIHLANPTAPVQKLPPAWQRSLLTPILHRQLRRQHQRRSSQVPSH